MAATEDIVWLTELKKNENTTTEIGEYICNGGS
jgi:hypothetical protein